MPSKRPAACWTLLLWLWQSTDKNTQPQRGRGRDLKTKMMLRESQYIKWRWVLSEASSFHFIAYEILRVNAMPLVFGRSHTSDAACEEYNHIVSKTFIPFCNKEFLKGPLKLMWRRKEKWFMCILLGKSELSDDDAEKRELLSSDCVTAAATFSPTDRWL